MPIHHPNGKSKNQKHKEEIEFVNKTTTKKKKDDEKKMEDDGKAEGEAWRENAEEEAEWHNYVASKKAIDKELNY